VREPEPSQVLTRGEIRPLKLGMDRLRHGLISRRGSGRGHMSDQVRALFLTGFSHMHGCHQSTLSRAFCASSAS
jgi:hypothetical protein